MSRAGYLLVTVLVLILAGGQFLMGAAGDAPEVFKFRFKTGEAHNYKMKLKMDIDMNIQMMGQNINNKMVIDMAWNIKMVPISSTAEMTRVSLEPGNPEMTMDISGAMGNLKATIKDGHVFATQGGTTVIDTRNGIGTAQAQEMSNELKALSIKGEVELSSDGRKATFNGSPEFKKFWEDAMESQVGFFSIFFPQKAVAVGETYSETITLKKMGQIVLEGAGLSGTVHMTREANKMVNGRNVSVFKLSSPLNQKDLVGYMEQGGVKTRVDIKNMQRKAEGYTYFDNVKGELLKSALDASADMQMSASFQGQSGDITMKLTMVMDIEKF